MALHFPDNRYPGVNAHLNSYLQQPVGLWSSFHATFVVVLARRLDQTLPPNYFAVPEQGLQITLQGAETLQQKGTYPNVGVLRQMEGVRSTAGAAVTAPIAEIPLMEVDELLPDDETRATRVSLYRSTADAPQLVTAIELLSKANKSGTYHPVYLSKRRNLLSSGVNLLEIDLLHETRPVIQRIPSYADDADGAFPHNIIVSRPTPDVQSGKMMWYAATVAQALPTIPLPLLAAESVACDLQGVYNSAFSDLRYFSQLVDYETLPVHFERYSEADQASIKSILDGIRQAARDDA